LGHTVRLMPPAYVKPYVKRHKNDATDAEALVFSLIAVTLFVVIYSYQKSKYANREIVEDLRQRSVDVYLAAKTPEA
jgi:transposase